METSPAFKPWMVGIVYLPFGLFNGFLAAGLALLLTSHGASLATVGGVTFIALLPSFLSFLITPLVDCGMPRRVWSLLLAAVCAACLCVAVSLVGDAARGGQALPLLTAAMTLGCLAAQMYGSSIGGMVPNLVSEDALAGASTFLNIAYLGGTGVGGTVAVFAATKLPLAGTCAVLACEMLLPALCLFAVRGEDRTPAHFTQAARELGSNIVAALRIRRIWTGFAIFITPCAAFVAVNYFGGMGADFHASDSTTAWITGTGFALLASAGSIAGGLLLKRINARWLVITPGILSALATLGMAFGAKTATVFLAGVCWYALMAGINYVAVTAYAFDLIGPGHPLSATLYSMLMAACNVAIETVVLTDRTASTHNGARGLLIADAAISAGCGIALVAVLKAIDHKRRKGTAQPVAS